jgi:ABC-type nickel/cobalt efflux system permease component RcnA
MNFWDFPFISAFLLGALHSLEPGHGKSLLALHTTRNEGIKSGLYMLGSLLFTHFALVFLVSGVFYMIPEIRHNDFLSIAAPVIIISYGSFMLIRNSKKNEEFLGCSCSHETTKKEREQKNKKDQILMGFIAGLTPCPSVFAPVIISLGSPSFGQVFLYVLSYMLGIIVVFVALYLLFFLLKDRALKPFMSLTKSFNPHIISGAILIAIGIFYLFLYYYAHVEHGHMH